MKKLAIALCALSLTFMSCNEDDNNSDNTVLSEAEIPVEIKTYITDHFPSNSINRAETEVDDNETFYNIYLSENFNLEFNSGLTITNIDANSQLPNSVIPQSILDYVSQNYPDNFITDWELESDYQEVELNNGLELEFSLEGVFIRVDENNDDDDDNEVILTANEIPSEIKTYVTTHFPNNSITRAIKETENNVVSYELHLTENIELNFNDAFEITEIDGTSKLPDSVIQPAILDYVTLTYPNNFITDWELENDHQQVELDDETELEFTLNGEFIRIDND